MYELREEFKKGSIRIDINENLSILIDDDSNSNMDYDTFKLLCDNGYTSLFDLTKRIER